MQAFALQWRELGEAGRGAKLSSFGNRFGVPLHPCAVVTVVGYRKLEEVLQMTLKQEEILLEQMQAQMQQNEEILFLF